MTAKPEPDVAFPVMFHGDRHWGVRLGTEALPGYFAKMVEAQVHLKVMIYRRQHGGALPEHLEQFVAAARRVAP